MSAKIYPVILCGGSGTRLWPLSRQSFPKQFANIFGNESLFQASINRFSSSEFENPIVVTGDPFRFVVTEQLEALDKRAHAILIEPTGKNTAPAILASALMVNETDKDALILVSPSDHLIENDIIFRSTVIASVNSALNGDLVTFGIAPTRAETGYGWLELETEERSDEDVPIKLKGFIEKPSLNDANSMLEAGNFLWNAGIFLFSVSSIILAFKKYAPHIYECVSDSISNAKNDLDFIRLDSSSWDRADNISIDYAIMEKAENLVVMPFSGEWSDLGGWESIWKESNSIGNGNVVSGEAFSFDCRDTLLRSEDENIKLVGVGLDDLVVVAMRDAVLVANKKDSQKIKEIVSTLKNNGVRQATEFLSDRRPWGWFESLVRGDRFQVKRIVVKPGAALSLQSHHHRSEHWIVVEGTAKVIIDTETKLVTENQSVYIPLGAIHRLENPGKFPVVLIEVQTGSYLGEDDIIRYQDNYSRS